jgi:hypothetical protein
MLQAEEGLDDDQLAVRLGVVRQQINQVARQLAAEGHIRRATGRTGKIVNTLSDTRLPALPSEVPAAPSSTLLTEDEVKLAMHTYLEAQGYSVTVMWGRARGVDIDAIAPNARVLIEAKGDAPTPQMQGNYFLGALGELVQRMADPDAQYGLALPDNRRYRGLAERLPDLVVRRLRLRFYFVTRKDASFVVAEVAGEQRGEGKVAVRERQELTVPDPLSAETNGRHSL